MRNPIFAFVAVWFLLGCYTLLHAQDANMRQIDSLERLLPNENKPEKLCSLYLSLAFRYVDFDLLKTKFYAQKAIELAKAEKLTTALGKAYNNMAIYYMSISMPDSALYFYEKSLENSQKIGDEKGVADVLGNMGTFYYYQGNYQRSMEYNLQSLRKFEHLNYKPGMANEALGLGSVYMEMKQYEQAIRYDTMAMRLYQEIDDQEGIATVLGNLANIYENQGKRDKAKTAYQEAIAMYEKTGNSIGIGRNLSNLSTLYIGEGNYRAALEQLTKADQFFKESSFTQGFSFVTGNMGMCFFRSYQKYHHRDSTFHLVNGGRAQLLSKAIQLFEEALKYAKQNEGLSEQVTWYNMLSEVYAASGNLARSLEYHKLYTIVKDSLHSVESLKAVEQLTTEREVELKNKQIELDRLAVEKKRNERVYFLIGIGLLFLSILFVYRNYVNQKKSNIQLANLNQRISLSNQALESKNFQLADTLEELKQTQEQLIETEKQKENALIRSNISQDIHDDISSGLNKICWLAESFMLKTAKTQPPIDTTTLEKINAYARDTVSKLSEIIWSSNPERDNLASLLSFMRKYVENYMEDAPMHWRIAFPEDVPDLTLSPDLRRNLYLVMKEALHNARKYSQAQEIVLSFAIDSDTYQLEVRDNGVGIRPEHIQGGGNGLHNMRRRMAAVGGQIQMDSEEGKGTVIRATCKLSN